MYLVRCLRSGKGISHFPLTWLFLHSSSFQHDWDPYAWWFSDAAITIGDSRVCVRCLSPHEGVALQVAPHMPGWPFHYSLWCNSIYLMMSALAACSTSLIFIYQSDFVSPSPFVGGTWVVFVSHVLRYYCISPGCYPRHSMYVGSLIVFLYGSRLCRLYFMVWSLVYWTHYSFVLCLGGHRYASPVTFSTGTLS